jgi:hypothetical protein
LKAESITRPFRTISSCSILEGSGCLAPNGVVCSPKGTG